MSTSTADRNKRNVRSRDCITDKRDSLIFIGKLKHDDDCYDVNITDIDLANFWSTL